MEMSLDKLSKTVIQDLKNNRKESILFNKYNKEDIVQYLSNPQVNENRIREVSDFLYINSSHYRRLCNFLSKLPTYNYTIIPSNLEEKVNKKALKSDYIKVVSFVDKLNLKHYLPIIFNVCMYEDTYFGLVYETETGFDVIPVNAKYCAITSKENSLLKFSINFDYFKSREYLLDSYGEEIKRMYQAYNGYTVKNSDGTTKKVKGDKTLQWQEPSNQLCFKVNEDQLLYSTPPFVGIFSEIFNLEDYKLLKKSGELLDRYNILHMLIPLDEENRPTISEPDVIKYYTQTANSINPNIGLSVSPMKMEKFDFQNSRTNDSDAVLASEGYLWSAAGSNGALFGQGDKLSSASIEMSVRNDETLVFALLRQAEIWVNDAIDKLGLTNKFKIKFLNQSIYNESETFENYIKGGQYGLPVKGLCCAALGLSPAEILSVTTLENDILKLTDSFIPLVSSNTQSSDAGGRPTNKSKGEKVSDKTETGIESNSNDEN